LSGNSQITVKPDLEILNNSVKAGHGVAIGRFNDQEIYYLQSRGLNHQQSYKLLSRGFLSNLVNSSTSREIVNFVKKNFGRLVSAI